MALAENGIIASRPNGSRTVGRIPVRNLWLLMLYASDLVRLSSVAWIRFEENPDELPDLISELLCRSVDARLRHNLGSGYRIRHEVLSRVRGRIDILQTVRKRLLERGRVACRFEQLTIDTPRNRFIRVALETVSHFVSRSALHHRCIRLASDLALLGVSSICPTAAELAADQFGRHDSDDRLTVALAQLALDLALPTEDAGTDCLFSPAREIEWVRRLYEKAVAGFYGTVLAQRGWLVRAGQGLTWPLDWATTGISTVLPHMRTDIILHQAGSERRIVIDTKFNALLTKGWHRDETLRSAYLYQIYAYLRSQEGDPLTAHAEGLLLHPAIGGETFDEAVQIQGHVIRFSTVDLAGPAAQIRERLLRVVEEPLG